MGTITLSRSLHYSQSNTYIFCILLLDPTPPTWLYTPFSQCIFSVSSLAPLIPLPAHPLISTLTCFYETSHCFSLVSLIPLPLFFFFSAFQPTTAASPSCQPSPMWEPLNCHPLATRWSIRVSLVSTWLEDQSTGPAGPMGAGQGSRLSVQVSTQLHYSNKRTWRTHRWAEIHSLILIRL